jgi:hypothetical protein
MASASLSVRPVDECNMPLPWVVLRRVPVAGSEIDDLERLARDVGLPEMCTRYATTYTRPDGRTITSWDGESVRLGMLVPSPNGRQVPEWYAIPSDATPAHPHPSPRSTPWLRQDPWFEADPLPDPRGRVAESIAGGAPPAIIRHRREGCRSRRRVGGSARIGVHCAA